ncbi:MAG: hypothetical protein WC023_03560 [Rhodocyclaceae bacterium]
MKQSIRTFFITAVLALSSLSAWAHGGEDHGDEGNARPAPTSGAAPRAIAQTEEFELVAVLEGNKLTLTVDRFATNEPVVDAQIELEGGSLKAVATQGAPGVYTIPGEHFVAPGKYPLAISIEAGESADLLTTTLDLAAPATGVEHSHAASEWSIWGAAGTLLLAGAGLIVLRRRHKNRNRN